MGADVDPRALAQSRIFAGFGESDLASIAAEMGVRAYAAGQTLVREGDEGDELFIISKGTVTVSICCADGASLEVSTLRSGDFFGEMSVVERAPRSATCVALEDCELFSLSEADFESLMRAKPLVAARLMRSMLEVQLSRLQSLGSLVAEMAQWGDEARARAVTDQATGLFNRRYYEDSFESLVSRSKVEGKPLSLAMFDLDHFGDLNREWGIAFGDELIVSMAGVFRGVFTERDILVRYGGDEFVFIFPGTGYEGAGSKCDALCEAVRRMRFPGKDGLAVTCSLGYSTFPDRASSAAELIQAADKALYSAKEAGRDRATGG
jgi:diguanylate cyclase (GGDEF)-like protein